ncbi:MAG: PilT/PilU family type 4a pilus ATPase [Betaproteobacteria bacterium]|jgi:twitching motility protein PilU|nr:PilT/PilU family type 4a pilus ATPase [Betaproteobacteria bacterium]
MTREQASQLMSDLLKLMLSHRGSDLFISADFPPAIKIDGVMTKASSQALQAEHTNMMARAVMTDRQLTEFERTKECNFAIGSPGLGRFRVNAFVQLGKVGMVLRSIPLAPPSIDGLQLPPILKDIAMNQRGLFIVVGGTGTGKSTTQAAVLDWRNENSHGHILTVEDPIEFIHPHKNCLVTHREVGLDTDSWHVAMKNAMRQAPDVIMFGELRDRETMELAMDYAETGHFCLATLHANSANQAMDRIINFFPQAQRNHVLQDLSLNLRAIVSQRLLPRKGSKGRLAAVEVLINSPMVASLIKKGEVAEIKEIMKKSGGSGMQTFDQALFLLYRDGRISLEDALHNADSPNDLRLEIRLRSTNVDPATLMANTGDINIV